MANKGLRAISYHGTRKIEAGYKPLHTTEALIGYIECYRLVFFFFNHFSVNCYIVSVCRAFG